MKLSHDSVFWAHLQAGKFDAGRKFPNRGLQSRYSSLRSSITKLFFIVPWSLDGGRTVSGSCLARSRLRGQSMAAVPALRKGELYLISDSVPFFVL